MMCVGMLLYCSVHSTAPRYFYSSCTYYVGVQVPLDRALNPLNLTLPARPACQRCTSGQCPLNDSKRFTHCSPCPLPSLAVFALPFPFTIQSPSHSSPPPSLLPSLRHQSAILSTYITVLTLLIYLLFSSDQVESLTLTIISRSHHPRQRFGRVIFESPPSLLVFFVSNSILF